jgi:hypothetical protein
MGGAGNAETEKGKHMTSLQTKIQTRIRAALKRVLNTMTYDGFNVGSRVTDDEYDQLSYAATVSLDDLDLGEMPLPILPTPTKAQTS